MKAMDKCKEEEDPPPNEEHLFGSLSSEFCAQPWLYHLGPCHWGGLFDLPEPQCSHL